MKIALLLHLSLSLLLSTSLSAIDIDQSQVDSSDGFAVQTSDDTLRIQWDSPDGQIELRAMIIYDIITYGSLSIMGSEMWGQAADHKKRSHFPAGCLVLPAGLGPRRRADCKSA